MFALKKLYLRFFKQVFRVCFLRMSSLDTDLVECTMTDESKKSISDSWSKEKPKSGGLSKQSRVVPNYFISIPVTNPEIRTHIGNVQQSILKHSPHLKEAFVGLPTLHLTAMVMHLADEADIDRAKLALDDCRTELLVDNSFICPVLDVCGIHHFGNSVLFAKLVANSGLEQLTAIVDTVGKCYANHGIVSTDARSFKPHITILKLSKAPLRKGKGTRKLSPDMYADHVEQFMGKESVGRLQLCAMNVPKNEETGYYHIAHEIELK